MQVYCQPIQYNIQPAPALQGVADTSPLRSYAWQPDYFEADLRQHRQFLDTSGCSDANSSNDSSRKACSIVAGPGPHWIPLAQPQLVFELDFNCPDPLTEFQPAAQPLDFAVDAPGVCNAVAFWFELQLDEQTVLSSSPYSSTQQTGKHTTWKQVGCRPWLVRLHICRYHLLLIHAKHTCNHCSAVHALAVCLTMYPQVSSSSDCSAPCTHASAELVKTACTV
jgi:hypothetical protein